MGKIESEMHDLQLPSKRGQRTRQGKARQGTSSNVLQGSVALESPTKNTIINKNVTNMFVGM